MVICREDFVKSMSGRGYLGNIGRYDKGPEGLGDPDDKTLLDIEKNNIIPGYARNIVLRDYCSVDNQEYEKCRLDSHFYNRFYNCSEHKRTVNSCVKDWLNKLDLREQATAEYLEDRRLLRLTGLTKQERENYITPTEGMASRIVDKIRSWVLKEEEIKNYQENKEKKKIVN